MEKKQIKSRASRLEEIDMMKKVYDMLIKGLTNRQIKDNLMNDYHYEERNAHRLLYKVYKQLVIVNEVELEQEKNKYIDMYLNLYQRAIDNNDVRAATQVLKNLSDLQGLNIQKIEAKVENIVVEF